MDSGFWAGQLQSREFDCSTGILPVCHGQDGRATRDVAVLLGFWADWPIAVDIAVAFGILLRFLQ